MSHYNLTAFIQAKQLQLLCQFDNVINSRQVFAIDTMSSRRPPLFTAEGVSDHYTRKTSGTEQVC